MLVSNYVSLSKRVNCVLDESKKNIKVSTILSNFNKTKLGFCLIKNKSSYKIFTDGDFRRQIFKDNHFIFKDSSYIKKKKIITIDHKKSLFDAYNLMKSKDINVIIVLKNKKYFSYITFHEIVNQLSPERINLDKEKLAKYDLDVSKHLIRYQFVSTFVNSDMEIIDAACGTGYGSNLLAKKAKRVLGIDYSKEAILFAKANYQSKNITFKVDNILNFNFKKKYDAIITLETLEHLSKSQAIKWLKKCKNSLKSNSTFICSSPMLRVRNNKPYITNPHHLYEMKKQEFFANLKKIFRPKTINFFIQKNDSFVLHTNQKEGLCMAILNL